MADTQTAEQWTAATAVSVGKDLVALLRDAVVFVLAMLLLVFPTQFNTILVNAGFEEGSVVGFKWKSKLVESDNALKEAQATISGLQAKNDELVKALAETNAKLNDPALTERVAKLQAENKRLKDATQQVQSTVSEAIEGNMPLVEKAAASTDRRGAAPRSKADYSVGLQTLGVSDDERVTLNQKVQAEGYGLDPISWSYPAGERPAWFAPRSTVFFYANSARGAAEALARVMRSLTGQEFAVQRGAGLGVDPARKDVTLYVHYIKH